MPTGEQPIALREHDMGVIHLAVTRECRSGDVVVRTPSCCGVQFLGAGACIGTGHAQPHPVVRRRHEEPEFVDQGVAGRAGDEQFAGFELTDQMQCRVDAGGLDPLVQSGTPGGG